MLYLSSIVLYCGEKLTIAACIRRESNSSMSDLSQNPLQWLAEQHFEEQRTIRNAEENLFNWTSSIFLAGLGALTGIRGMQSNMSWDFWWRIFIIGGVAVFISVILIMAYLIRRSYLRNNAELVNVLSQIRIPAPQHDAASNELFFYVRWSALVALGIVTVSLVWMLG
jgi:hypothetical protein